MPNKKLISDEWVKVCPKADCHKAGIAQPIEGFGKDKSKPDGLVYQCKKCRKAYLAQPENKARKKAYNAEHRAQPENKARRNQRWRDRYHSDPVYRLECLIRRSICASLKANGWTKGGKTFDYLPYSPEGLMEHLENLFDEHMTWDNHGTYWHIDHIRPHASFKYDSLDHPDFQKCWALENLRPLKASENMSKGSFWEGKRHYYNEAA